MAKIMELEWPKTENGLCYFGMNESRVTYLNYVHWLAGVSCILFTLVCGTASPGTSEHSDVNDGFLDKWGIRLMPLT